MARNDAILQMLTRFHEPYMPCDTTHGCVTRKQAHAGKVAQAKLQGSEIHRREWEEDHKNRVTIIGAAELFDGNGQNGVWDVVDAEVGAKTLPSPNCTPWAIVTNVGLTVLLWPDGRLQLNLLGDSVAEAERLEKVISQRFGLERKNTTEYKRECTEAPQRISYGVMGEAARNRSQGRVFRSARPPWQRH